jgi:flagellar biosynthesis anti-sigma factor FlgM
MSRIDATKPVQPLGASINGASAKADAKKSEAKNASVSNYKVEISPESQDLSQIRTKVLDAAKNTSPEREERIQALKTKIQAGQYEVQPEQIADGMMREALKDHIALRMHDEANER